MVKHAVGPTSARISHAIPVFNVRTLMFLRDSGLLRPVPLPSNYVYLKNVTKLYTAANIPNTTYVYGKFALFWIISPLNSRFSALLPISCDRQKNVTANENKFLL